jgi:dolichol-phosphate mannosyltransferase
MSDAGFPRPDETRPELSVVVPVRDEAGNIAPLVTEIVAALAGEAFEIVCVDDGSRDGTAAELATTKQRCAQLRTVIHVVAGGQSAALWTGVRAARAQAIVTLDGDGQNDPADIPRLLALARAADAPADLRLIVGTRLQRRDSWAKREASRVANAVRARLLGDASPDSGCGLKWFRRADFLALPRFDHMHRFLPALFQREGGRVLHCPVNHRPRRAGRSKYGIADRLWVGIVDLMGVWWLRRRAMRADERNRNG